MSDRDSPHSLQAAIQGPRSDPFTNWPDSDLLAGADDQEFLRRHYGAIAPIFDWPELRTLFEAFSAPARQSRARGRRLGVRALAAGFASLALIALLPMIAVLPAPDDAATTRREAIFGAVAAFFALIAIIMVFVQARRGQAKTRWLANRFCAERIRQFHFQLILNNLPRIVAAIADRDKMIGWLRFRKDQLDRFEHEFVRFAGENLQRLLANDADDRTWLVREWFEPGAVPPASAELEALLQVMREQRLGIQRRYAALKLKDGWHSPDTRARAAARAGDTLTMLLLFATLGVGAAAGLAALKVDTELVRAVALTLAGVCSAGIVAVRVLDQGLQLSAEAERCKWYLAFVESLELRFTHADARRKVDLLREMEQLCYQEMHRFVASVANSRFVM